MESALRAGRGRFAAAIAMTIVLGVLVAVVRIRAADEPKACCFTNERYTGTCIVTPNEGETCESILAYLNNPSSTGKDYCGGTHIRGGWAQVDCDAAKPAAQKSTAGSTAHRQNDNPAQTQGVAR